MTVQELYEEEVRKIAAIGGGEDMVSLTYPKGLPPSPRKQAQTLPPPGKPARQIRPRSGCCCRPSVHR